MDTKTLEPDVISLVEDLSPEAREELASYLGDTTEEVVEGSVLLALLNAVPVLMEEDRLLARLAAL